MQRRAHELDDIWRILKPWGKFQIGQLVLVLVDYIPAAFAILSAVFTGYIPEYECEVPTANGNETSAVWNITFKPHMCHYNVYNHTGNASILLEKRTCDNYVYSKENTYSSEWNLVCSRANLAALAQSLVLAGQGLGALTMSHVADRLGRKTVHIISHIGVLGSMIVMAFSQNIYMLLTMRLVTGTFQQGIVCTGKTLALELFPVEIRAHTAPLGSLAWSFGVMLLAPYGYIFRDIDWRYLQLAFAAFSIYALAEWWMLEESVRWLISNGRLKEAKVILKKAAKRNEVDFSKLEDLLEENINLSNEKRHETDLTSEEMESLEDEKGRSNNSKLQSSKTVEKYTVLDILKNPSLRIDTFILWYSWIVAAGVYYGLTLVSTHLAGDRFLNFFLSGVMEFPSHLVCFFLYNRLGRKKTMILWYALAGISLVVSTVLLTVLEGNSIAAAIATLFSLLGKAGITGGFSTVFLYTPEIYPTNYRNSGLGIASSISRIGALLAPFASNLALISLWIPGAIFGGMCLLVVILALRLPESAKHELPTTIEDFDKWDTGQRMSKE
ncbi:organic cation transporter protein-like isoform X1 [Mercenaria mercenaria]|uniref:organic cation transporter protein-like isoform X1 n=1 Tax=Mercenaria mercenaria TaxID=6596 RepID=UPI00234F9BB4|nr:organic cation transporter protein-like isoform X1 [Mercenaria mercenaria]